MNAPVGTSTTPTGANFRTARRAKYAVFGCAALLILSMCGCAALGATSLGLLSYVSQEPEDLVVDYSIPDRVELGEEFEFILTLTNTGNSEILVGDIDFDEPIGGSILDGVTVIGTHPQMERNDPMPGFRSFHYGRTIPPGEQRLVAFRLQAATPGEFGGAIEVYVGDLAKSIDYVGITIVQR